MGAGQKDVKRYKALNEKSKSEEGLSEEEATEYNKLLADFAEHHSGEYLGGQTVEEKPVCQSCGHAKPLAVHFGPYAQCKDCQAKGLPLNKPEAGDSVYEGEHEEDAEEHHDKETGTKKKVHHIKHHKKTVTHTTRKTSHK